MKMRKDRKRKDCRNDDSLSFHVEWKDEYDKWMKTEVNKIKKVLTKPDAKILVSGNSEILLNMSNIPAGRSLVRQRMHVQVQKVKRQISRSLK